MILHLLTQPPPFSVLKTISLHADSGANSHVLNNRKYLYSFQSIDSTVTLENNTTTTAKGIGSCIVQFLKGYSALTPHLYVRYPVYYTLNH